ncbi:MAG: MBOAT family protein [Kiritimatiellae bacterium]|nr:MBOAT family protein [Kiritimatiellia bacterium]
MSLVFYSAWNPVFLFLLLGSVVFNFLISLLIRNDIRYGAGRRKIGLYFAVAINLLLLGYYKYATFFTEILNDLVGTSMTLGGIILPIGISFFTFQQIAYQVDAFRGDVEEHGFLKYLLFVCYFPQLIAGPIVHHKQIIPQIMRKNGVCVSRESLIYGGFIFVLGLAKKVLLADTLALYVTPVFGAAEHSGHISCGDAWIAVISYSGQIYFDFSGYCDMAIGAAAMMGIVLPMNFNSPYKSGSIIEFWRRWHITLSVFLRDYLYISLGGNRKGSTRRYVNLFVTMLLGGLWHGASWSFVVWGGIHGVFLIINHLWRKIIRQMPQQLGAMKLYNVLCGFITITVVTLAWVFFRAESFRGAVVLFDALLSAPSESVSHFYNLRFPAITMIVVSAIIVFLMPNVAGITDGVFCYRKQLIAEYRDGSVVILNIVLGVVTGCIFSVSLLALQRNSVFIYYQF